MLAATAIGSGTPTVLMVFTGHAGPVQEKTWELWTATFGGPRVAAAAMEDPETIQYRYHQKSRPPCWSENSFWLPSPAEEKMNLESFTRKKIRTTTSQ